MTLSVTPILTGCASLQDGVGFYWQAARGHMSMMQAARPITEWLADPATPEPIRQRLKLALEIREYASTHLGLPDNGSYRSYADLKRPFVVWNVMATPELSLRLRQWCFPIAGCVSYRGYYSKELADEFASRLRASGDDVQVGGVPAYSTLGYLDDPLLNSFIHYPAGELARLIFHELAHQVVYVQGDTQFNESFATAVEILGVERWLNERGSAQMTADYQAYVLRRADFIGLLQKFQNKLKILYAEDSPTSTNLEPTSVEQKRSSKARLITELRQEYEQIKLTRWNGFRGYDRFFAQNLGNAHLAAVATYNEQVPGFLKIAESLDLSRGLEPLFNEVRQLAKRPKTERDAKLGTNKKPTETP